MASSGVIQANGGSRGRTLEFRWWTIEKSIAGNYTNIGYTLKAVGGNSGYINGRNINLYIAGEHAYSSGSVQLYDGTVLKEGNKWIYHNNIGNAYFEVAFDGAIYSHSTNTRGSGGFDLDNIPRKSYFESAGDFWDDENPGFVITNPAGLYTEIQLQFFGKLYFKRTISSNGTADSIKLSDDERTTLRNLLRYTNSYNFNWVITTYSGSTEIGRQYVQRTVKVRNANPQPIDFNISEDYREIKNNFLYGTENKFIQGVNKLKISNISSIQAQKGAIPDHYEIRCDDMFIKLPSNTKEYTFNSNGNTENEILKTSGKRTVSVRAVDSRGNYSEKVKEIEVIPYTKPEIYGKAKRKNNFEEDTIIEINGNIKDVNSRNRINTVQYRYKKSTDSSYIRNWTNVEIVTSTTNEKIDFKLKPVNSKNIIIERLDKNASYTFEIRVIDTLNQSIAKNNEDKYIYNTFEVNKGETFVFFNANKKIVTINEKKVLTEADIPLSKILVTARDRSYGSDNFQVELENTSFSRGNTMELRNNAIEIKEDCVIKFSGSVFMDYSTNGYIRAFVIRQRRGSDSVFADIINEVSNAFGSIPITPTIIDCVRGDKIYIKIEKASYRGDNNRGARVRGGYSTYFLSEQI